MNGRLLTMAIGLMAGWIASGSSYAQSWNVYDNYNAITIPFASGPMTPSNPGQIYLQVGSGVPTKFTMDTGSTGITATPDHYTPGPNDQNLGPGQLTYNSSGIIENGTYWLTNVNIQNGAGNTVATAQVKILQVTSITCQANARGCTANPNPTGTAFMGIGFDRGAAQSVPSTANMNPFLNLTSLASGQPVSSIRPGYLITDGSVTLGMTGALTQNFAFVKLTPNTTMPSEVWNAATMTVSAGGATGTGTILQDSGINYMFLTPPAGAVLQTAACPTPPGGKNCIVPGSNTQISIYLPGQSTPQPAFYTFTTGTTGNALQPNVVDVVGGSAVYINTGREFFEGFDYLYDAAGGYVGYRWNGQVGSAFGAVTPILSLESTVNLANGFSTSLPVILAGNTTLMQQGSGTFNASVMGANSNLTIGSGLIAFNAPVNLGTGGFNIQQGQATINTSLTAATINIGAQGILAGNGTIIGDVTHSGVLSPGNSIGTINIVGNYTQTPGSFTYLAEVSGTSISDRINVTGIATLQGGTVGVAAAPGSYAPRTTYTILSAAGGIVGGYSNAVSNYPFLQPSLNYDANNVYLTLQVGGFAQAAQTPAQAAVGAVLDANAGNATGDFATVLGALSTLTTGQGVAVLNAISGQNYAAFSSAMVQGAQLFMSNFSTQTGGGGGLRESNRVALAEACTTACDTTLPALWGAWGSALGGLGSIGNGSSNGAVTYNVGGFAAGLDRVLAPGLRAGVTVGYSNGTQWVAGFDGRGVSNTFQTGLYANYNEGKVYADALLGYAYSSNQMWRNIAVPGLASRTAQGTAGANQFFGQIEGGYRFDFGGDNGVFVTPFARLQAYTATQNAFTESGAGSLNLSIASQTTNSLRTVLGAQLGASMDMGWRERLALQFRLGWSHEFADTARPVTAILAGAPAMPFTTFGASPLRDGAVVGFAASTAIAQGVSAFLRYEGDISGQDSTHALAAGVRIIW
jgi:outer membrane autotransporter protein